MQPQPPDNNKRQLPMDYYLANSQSQDKKTKYNDDSQMVIDEYAQDKFNSYNNDYSYEINLSDIEACELTEELSNLPLIWHCAKNKNWDAVNDLLDICSDEDFTACLTVGPDKNKTIMILAILSERWDIAEKIGKCSDSEATLEIAEFNKLIELIVINNQWKLFYHYLGGASLPAIDQRTFDLFVDHAIENNSAYSCHSLLWFLDHIPISISNRQFNINPIPISNQQYNDIVSCLIDRIILYEEEVEKDGSDNPIGDLEGFFDKCSNLNFQLNEDVLKKLHMAIIFADWIGFNWGEKSLNDYFKEKLFQIKEKPELFLEIVENFCFNDSIEELMNLLLLNSWVYEISCKENESVNDSVGFIVDSILSELVGKYRENEEFSDKSKYRPTTEIELIYWVCKVVESFLKMDGLALSTNLYQKICNNFNEICLELQDEIDSIDSKENLTARELEIIEDAKKCVQSVAIQLIFAGVKVPNIHKLNIPNMNTFERIALILQWPNQFGYLPVEINYKIALNLIRAELPILKDIDDLFLVGILQAYFSRKKDDWNDHAISHIVSLAFKEFRWQNGTSGYLYTKTEIDQFHQLIEECLREYLAAYPWVLLKEAHRERIVKEIGRDQNVEFPILEKSFIKRAIADAMNRNEFVMEPEIMVIDIEEKVNSFETIKNIATAACKKFCDENLISWSEKDEKDFYELIEDCLLGFEKQYPERVFTEAKIDALVKEIGKYQNVAHPKLKKSNIEEAIRNIIDTL